MATNTHTTPTRRAALTFGAAAIVAGIVEPATAAPETAIICDEIALAWRKAWRDGALSLPQGHISGRGVA